MSAPTHTISRVQNGVAEATPPLDRPDYLASALLQSLMRPMSAPYSTGLVRTVVIAILSVGIVPLILLPGKLRRFAARERDQLWHLAQWMRLQFGNEADALEPRTPALDRAMHLLRLITWGAALFAFGSLIWFLNSYGDPERLLKMTMGYFHYPHRSWRDDDLFTAWTSALCIGYAAHWCAVQVHQARVRTFVSSFNEFALRKSIYPIDTPPEVFGLRPMWLGAALIFLWCGVLWGVPLMLAGAAQTRYIKHRSRWTRQDLAQRVRDVLRTVQPNMILTVPVALRKKCPVNVCQAPLPQTAVFCPRCGMRVAAVDRVA